jgi:hypothetical protein
VSAQPLLNPPGGADVGDPPARGEEVDAVPPHIIYASLKAAEEPEPNTLAGVDSQGFPYRSNYTCESSPVRKYLQALV